MRHTRQALAAFEPALKVPESRNSTGPRSSAKSGACNPSQPFRRRFVRPSLAARPVHACKRGGRHRLINRHRRFEFACSERTSFEEMETAMADSATFTYSRLSGGTRWSGLSIPPER